MTDHLPELPELPELPDLPTSRRTLLRTGAGLAFSTAALGTVGEAAAAGGPQRSIEPGRRAYVLVIDGCRPDELHTPLTPNLTRLAREGRHHPAARSLPVMETIPNHVMMMSGVRPDRSGVPANKIYDRGLGEVRDLDRPSDIRTPTIIEKLNARGLRTGTVLSKDYLYGIFGERATHRWEPFPLVPVTDHSLDEFTMAAARDMVTEFDPHLMFVNLGDIDRFGHADLTGTSLRVARRTALRNTDRLVGDFVALLKARGLWQRSMLVVLADHSMDWSVPWKLISLQPVIDGDSLLAGRVQIAQNGGADLLYWTGPDRLRTRAVNRMLDLVADVEGVERVRRVSHRPLRLGPEAGDVIAFCRAGWRFSDPEPYANPIPGNHGHFATSTIPFFISGGHPSLPRGTSSTRARTIDVAPTVMSFFGSPWRPRGGWDGTARV